MLCDQSMRFTLPLPAFVLLVLVAVAPAFPGRAEAAPLPVASRAVAGDAEFGRDPSWTMPGLPDVRRRVLAWLAETESARRSARQPLEPFAAARALWPAGDDGPEGTAAAVPSGPSSPAGHSARAAANGSSGCLADRRADSVSASHASTRRRTSGRPGIVHEGSRPNSASPATARDATGSGAASARPGKAGATATRTSSTNAGSGRVKRMDWSHNIIPAASAAGTFPAGARGEKPIPSGR